MRQSDDHHARRSQQDHRHNQAASFKAIAQRHQQQQTTGVAELRRGDNKPGEAHGEIKLLGDGIEQWLNVVITGYTEAGCYRHQHY